MNRMPGDELKAQQAFTETMNLLFAVVSTVCMMPLEEFLATVTRANLAVVNDVPIIGQYKDASLKVAKEIAEITLDYQQKVTAIRERLVAEERRLREGK